MMSLYCCSCWPPGNERNKLLQPYPPSVEKVDEYQDKMNRKLYGLSHEQSIWYKIGPEINVLCLRQWRTQLLQSDVHQHILHDRSGEWGSSGLTNLSKGKSGDYPRSLSQHHGKAESPLGNNSGDDFLTQLHLWCTFSLKPVAQTSPRLSWMRNEIMLKYK